MPNRIIHESCRTSETLAAVSANAERLFWRLTTVADDFGRFNANPRIVLSACFPLKVHEIGEAELEAWLIELRTAELVSLYEVEGKRYGLFVTWSRYQRTRAGKSKFPAAPVVNGSRSHAPVDTRGHLTASADIGGSRAFTNHDHDHDHDHDKSSLSDQKKEPVKNRVGKGNPEEKPEKLDLTPEQMAENLAPLRALTAGIGAMPANGNGTSNGQKPEAPAELTRGELTPEERAIAESANREIERKRRAAAEG